MYYVQDRGVLSLRYKSHENLEKIQNKNKKSMNKFNDKSCSVQKGASTITCRLLCKDKNNG